MAETIESEISVRAPPEDVWNVLADIEGISRWAAPVAEAEVEGEPGEGARRHCRFADGAEIDERFTAWEEGRLQRYEIEGDLPTDELVSEWELESDGDETHVAYRAEFTSSGEAPAEAVREELGETGEFLVQALKTFVERGEVLEPPEE